MGLMSVLETRWEMLSSVTCDEVGNIKICDFEARRGEKHQASSVFCWEEFFAGFGLHSPIGGGTSRSGSLYGMPGEFHIIKPLNGNLFQGEWLFIFLLRWKATLDQTGALQPARIPLSWKLRSRRFLPVLTGRRWNIETFQCMKRHIFGEKIK